MPLPLILGGFGCDMDGLVSGLSVREIAANRIMNKKGKREPKEVDTKRKTLSKKSDDSKNTDEN